MIGGVILAMVRPWLRSYYAGMNPWKTSCPSLRCKRFTLIRGCRGNDNVKRYDGLDWQSPRQVRNEVPFCGKE